VEGMLLSRLVAVGVVVGLAAACSGASSSGTDVPPAGPAPVKLSSCITDWPKGPDVPPALAAPLDVEAPRVLWRKPIHGDVMNNLPDGIGLVLSGRNLAAATLMGITVVDKEGNYTELTGWTASHFNRASSPTTDPAGNIYFTAPSGTYALTADGKAKWAQREGRVPYGEGMEGPSFGTALALDPNGILYGASNDGQLRAFRSSDGVVLWRARPTLLDPSEASYSFVLGGAGTVLFVQAGRECIVVFETRTGRELGRLRHDDGSEVRTFVFRWALGFTGTIFAGFSFLDNCGRVKWRYLLPQQNDRSSYDLWGAVLGLPERYAALIQAFDSDGYAIPGTNAMYYYDPEGTAGVGPKPNRGFPIAVGADGTLYTVSCRGTDPPENRLYAYTPALDELWLLNLGKNSWCPLGNGVLDSDGVLYFAIPNEDGGTTDVMAIQTKSPGLAPSAWPMLRHDNRGTMWLTSPSSESPVDGGTPVTDAAMSEEVAVAGPPVDGAVDAPLPSR
jgi:outer membrane protein assembly factor BamB